MCAPDRPLIAGGGLVVAAGGVGRFLGFSEGK